MLCHSGLQQPRNKSDYSVPPSVEDTTVTGYRGHYCHRVSYYCQSVSIILTPTGVILLPPGVEDTTATGCRGYYCHGVPRILLQPGVEDTTATGCHASATLCPRYYRHRVSTQLQLTYIIIIIIIIIITVRGTDKYVFTTRKAINLSYL